MIQRPNLIKKERKKERKNLSALMGDLYEAMSVHWSIGLSVLGGQIQRKKKGKKARNKVRKQEKKKESEHERKKELKKEKKHK